MADEDDEAEPLPPWAARAGAVPGVVPSLQTLVCRCLAQHLHAIESLDDLPEHLADTVREAIQQDRRLLSDSALAVWLGAASRGGSATKLTLRWASALSDEGMRVLATAEPEWAASLVELDMGYCENVTDAGLVVLAPAMTSLRALVLTGCTRCGDGACKSVGHHCSRLERCELELLQRVTDVGVQAIVRGCPMLSELRVGGCHRLSSISTSLIADHCSRSMRRLGLGGIADLNDVSLEDVGKCVGLEWLELCACPKVSDAGIKQIGLLAAKQMKAFTAWDEAQQQQQQQRGASAPAAAAAVPPSTLRHLDLGGLGRLTDTGLHKLLSRTRHLTSLDLRGCARLTEDGLANALANSDKHGVRVPGVMLVPNLQSVVLLALPDAASERVVSVVEAARPGLKITR
jgi:hypothetical protein